MCWAGVDSGRELLTCACVESGEGGAGAVGWARLVHTCVLCMRARADGAVSMWRLPQQLWIGPVLDRVAAFVGEGWERCEWCDERIGFPARHEDGNWQFVCPECAEPWQHIPFGPGLKGMAMDLGGSGGFTGPQGRRRIPVIALLGGQALAHQGGRWMRGSSGLSRFWCGCAWVIGAVRGRFGSRSPLAGPAPRVLSGRLVQCCPHTVGPRGLPAATRGTRRGTAPTRRYSYRTRLRDEGRRRGHGRWHSLVDLVAQFRRLAAFTFDDLWSAATLAYRNGTRRFDCFWQRDQVGGWEVWVLLKEEHVRNREGR